nr:MADS-box protein CMB1-like [Ipomoea batatas]
MGRGKVELKRIENKINRLMSFLSFVMLRLLLSSSPIEESSMNSAVAQGFVEYQDIYDSNDYVWVIKKKIQENEDCMLTDAEKCECSGIGFYCSMSKTLERYHRCSYGALEANQTSKDSQIPGLALSSELECPVCRVEFNMLPLKHYGRLCKYKEVG